MQQSLLFTFWQFIQHFPWWYYAGVLGSILWSWWFWTRYKPRPRAKLPQKATQTIAKLDLPIDADEFEREAKKNFENIGLIDLRELRDSKAPIAKEFDNAIDLQEEVDLLLKMSISHDSPEWHISEATLNLRKSAFMSLLLARHNTSFSVNRVLLDLGNADYSSLIYVLFINEKIAVEHEPKNTSLAAEYAKQQASFLYTPEHLPYAIESLQRALSYTSEDRYATQHLIQLNLRLGNIAEAIKYQQYLAILCYGEHKKSPELLSELHNLALCFEELHDLYLQQNNLEQALEAQKDANRIRHELMEREPANLQALQNVWYSHLHLATLFGNLKHFEPAIHHYRQGIQYGEKLYSFAKDNLDITLDLALNYRKLGLLWHQLAEHRFALVEFERSHYLYHKKYQLNPENLEVLSSYKMACCYLADELLVLAEYRNALKYFFEMYNLCNALIKLEHEIQQNWFYGAHASHKMATIYLHTSELIQALECAQNAILLHNRILAENAEHLISMRNLAISYELVADIYSLQEKYPDAMQVLDNNNLLRQKIQSKAPDDPVNSRSLAVSFYKLGNIYSLMGNHSVAYYWVHKSLDLMRTLTASDRSPNHLRDLAVSLEKLALLVMESKQYTTAHEYLREALKISEQLQAQYPENISYHTDLVVSYSRIYQLYPALITAAEAIEYLEKALKIATKLKYLEKLNQQQLSWPDELQSAINQMRVQQINS